MKSKIKILFLFFAVVSGLSGCSKSTTSGNSSSGSIFPSVTGPNTMDVHVSDVTYCTNNSYANEPCVSVKICSPGTTTCQTISNILLDTGSYGLRIFYNQVTVSLTDVTNGSSQPLVECSQFASSNAWGPVRMADVILGSESAVTIPIQVIYPATPGYATTPAACNNRAASSTDAGFNGILGVGLNVYDCGTDCVTDPTIGLYYACTSATGTCSQTTMPLSKQVKNPIAALPVDNNGVILTLASVDASGSTAASGQLIFGIGTQTNNSPTTGTTTYYANTSNEFSTSFNGTTYSHSFLDSGSNGIFFNATASTPACSSGSGFYCPTSTVSLSANIIGHTTGATITIPFSVANADTLFNSGNRVFPTLGGSLSGYFDWGLPFFLGRTVYVGISAGTSSLGTGPYWAF